MLLFSVLPSSQSCIHLNSNKHEIICRMHPWLFYGAVGVDPSAELQCETRALNTSIFVANIQVKVDVAPCVRQAPASAERSAGLVRACDWDTTITSDHEGARLSSSQHGLILFPCQSIPQHYVCGVYAAVSY